MAEVGDELKDVSAALGAAEKIELAEAMLAVEFAPLDTEIGVENNVVAVGDCVASSCEHVSSAYESGRSMKHLPAVDASSSGCESSGHPEVHGSCTQQPVQTT